MTAGDVVVLDFPFSNLSGSKLRPAIILADVGRDDFIACQVTSNRGADPRAIPLTSASFAAGGLRTDRFALPGKLFTAHRSIFSKRVGRLTTIVKDSIRDASIELLRRG